MASIVRNTQTAIDRQHDLIVIGGGVYGIALALEAVGRGCAPLLIERDDFGGATSRSSLRIVHGGLRYLQSLDLTRFRESVRERRWFLRAFHRVAPSRILRRAYSECRAYLQGICCIAQDVVRCVVVLDDQSYCAAKKILRWRGRSRPGRNRLLLRGFGSLSRCNESLMRCSKTCQPMGLVPGA